MLLMRFPSFNQIFNHDQLMNHNYLRDCIPVVCFYNIANIITVRLTIIQRLVLIESLGNYIIRDKTTSTKFTYGTHKSLNETVPTTNETQYTNA